MSLYKILKKPIFTEKASKAELTSNCYVFEVAPKATKIDIKKAILDMYGQDVASVNIIKTVEKFKYGKKWTQYKRRPSKKAYITLKDKKAKIEYSVTTK